MECQAESVPISRLLDRVVVNLDLTSGLLMIREFFATDSHKPTHPWLECSGLANVGHGAAA